MKQEERTNGVSSTLGIQHSPLGHRQADRRVTGRLTSGSKWQRHLLRIWAQATLPSLPVI